MKKTHRIRVQELPKLLVIGSPPKPLGSTTNHQPPLTSDSHAISPGFPGIRHVSSAVARGIQGPAATGQRDTAAMRRSTAGWGMLGAFGHETEPCFKLINHAEPWLTIVNHIAKPYVKTMTGHQNSPYIAIVPLLGTALTLESVRYHVKRLGVEKFYQCSKPKKTTTEIGAKISPNWQVVGYRSLVQICHTNCACIR